MDPYGYNPFGYNNSEGQTSNTFDHFAYNTDGTSSFNTNVEPSYIFNPFPQSSYENNFCIQSNHAYQYDFEIPNETEEDESNLLDWQTVCRAAAYTLVYYYESFVHKEPCHDSIRTGGKLIDEIMKGNEIRCYQDFRMPKDIFISFCRLLVDRYGLVPTQGMSEYEEVGIFLMTVAHGCGNRLMQEMWNHSGETISRHFHSVLQAVCRLASDYIKPASNYNTGCGYHTPQHERYHPYFEDAIGAIDGTHIKCRVKETERTPYFGRKGYATQNILAICDFNLCFTFAWGGWEGGAHDSRILNEATTQGNLNFPHPSGNKFYLVDAGYAHKKGYMAPYKGSSIRYHLADFRRGDGSERVPRNPKEKYNHLHSSCRMVIERTFGVWKARFAILANMPMYKIDTQTDIVLSTMAIHNYIRKSNCSDSAFRTAERESYIPPDSTTTTNRSRESEIDETDETDGRWIALRDSIANSIHNRA
ncbi:uncharacterized protein LOC141686303 [Apium graveolens]|uniref:uncharacterized protein LOC141686303 n=1 Tax=Apium graveolens TaxID=4045 RepID=UPI003D78F2C9